MSLQTKFLNVAKGTVTRVPVAGGAGAGCGNNKTLYVGRDGSFLYRSLLEFTQSWTDVGQIKRATLILYTDDGLGRIDPSGDKATPRIKVRRNTDEFTEGNNADETFNASDYTTSATSTSGAKTASMIKAADEATEIDVTAIWNALAPKKVKQSNGKPGAGRTDHGISLLPYSSKTIDAWSGRSEDWTDASKRPQIRLEYLNGPTKPTITNMTPASTVPLLPAFEGDFNDTDSDDHLAYAEIEVYLADGVTRLYQTRRAMSQTAVEAAHFSIETDLHLVANTTYKWRARVTDDEQTVSDWTALVAFEVQNNPPDPPVLAPADIMTDTLIGIRFAGGYSDSLDDPQDEMLAYQVQMLNGLYDNDDPAWDDPTQYVWNTGKRFVMPTELGFSTAYGGRGLAADSYSWRARVWDVRNGVSDWAYETITLTEDFDVDPAARDVVQIDPHTPWRLVFRDMLYTTSPDIEMLQEDTALDTVTLAEAEAGNLIIGWLTHRTTKPALPSGWKNIALTRYGTSSYWGRMIARTAGSADAPSVTQAGVYITLMEWRAVYQGKFRASVRHSSTTAFRAGGNVTPVKKAPAVLVGGGIWASANDDSGGTTASALSSTDEIVQDNPDDYKHWVGSRTISNPTKSYSLGGTLNHASRYGGVTMVLGRRKPSRGPGEIVAVIEDAKSTGASEMYNSPGELHFTVPTDHPQVNVLEPKQVHYEVQFYTGDGWRGVYFGLLMDADASDMTDVVFTGIDYLGLFDSQQDRRFDINKINKSEANGGSKYVNKTITYVVQKAIDRAINEPNSPVNFITRGAIATMSEKVTVWSTMIPTLSFITGLIDSHKQGTGNNTRVLVRPKTGGGFEIVVLDDPGQERTNLRMRYGELVQGYRTVFFGPNWKSRTNLIGRTRTGGKTYYTSQTAPGIDPTVWGAFEDATFIDGVSDLPDLKRRAKQYALTNGKLGQQLGLKFRQGLIQPKEGYDICDHIPVDVKEGIVDTSRFGSTDDQGRFYTIFGVAFEAGGPDGTDSSLDTILTLLPRNDLTSPDTDLVESQEAIGNQEFASGFGPPDDTVTAKFYLDLNTGILYARDDDANTDDDYDPDEGTSIEDEADQPDEGDP